MTRFLESFATQQTLPPWRAENVVTHAFVFELKAPVIQAYLDKFLNFPAQKPSPFLYWAMKEAQLGILVVSQFPKIASQNVQNMRRYGPDIEEWDHVSQTEIFVGVPVEKYDVSASNIMSGGTIEWIQPVIISDNASIVFSSREIIGLDTMYGEITLPPADVPGGLHLDCAIPQIKVFAPTSKETMLPFLHIEAAAPLDFATAMSSVAGESAHDDPFVLAVERVLGLDPHAPTPLPEAMRMVTLKQVRSTHNLNLARYQAIVGATMTRENIRDIEFFDPSKVVIDFMETDTTTEILRSFLDLQPGSAATSAPHDGKTWDLADTLNAPIRFAFRVTSDSTFHDVETLHTFS